MLKDLNAYRIFLEVAKFNNMSMAARQLYITPVTVTRTIQNLEKDLGCTLFKRNSKGVSLTIEGATLYEHLSSAFEALDAAQEQLTGTNTPDFPRLTIGSSRLFADYMLLNRCLTRLRAEHPTAQIVLKTISENRIAESLSNGSIDFALGNITNPRSEKIATLPLFSDKIVAIIGKGCSIAAAPEQIVSRLSTLPLVSLPPEHSISVRAMLAFRRKGAEYRPSLVVDRVDRIITAVRYNLGYAFLPASSVLDAVRNGLIDIIPIELKGLSFVPTMYYNSQRTKSPVEEAFINIVIDEAGLIYKEIQNGI